MSDQNQPAPKTDKDPVIPIPRENPFRAISRMFHSSVGRLPGHLVVIFCISLVLAVMAGVVLKLAETGEDKPQNYLVQRLEVDQTKPVLAEEALRGVWVHEQVSEAGGVMTTIRIGSGVFELMSWDKRNVTVRTFIRGGYRINGNVLILQQRKELGTPLDVNHPDYRFYPLEFEALNLYAQSDGRVMTWQTPAHEKKRLRLQLPLYQDLFGPESDWIKIAISP